MATTNKTTKQSPATTQTATAPEPDANIKRREAASIQTKFKIAALAFLATVADVATLGLSEEQTTAFNTMKTASEGVTVRVGAVGNEVRVSEIQNEIDVILNGGAESIATGHFRLQELFVEKAKLEDKIAKKAAKAASK